MVTLDVFQIDTGVPLDLWAEPLGRELEIRVYRLGTDAFPEAAGDATLILGGQPNAYEEQLGPIYERLAQDLAEGRPLLGICLGFQALAVAGGGRVDVGAEAGPENGIVSITWDDAARTDPLFGPVAGEDRYVISHHSDAVAELPAGATLLARSPLYPHAFRLGNAWGVQFHPEVSRETVRHWSERTADPLMEEIDQAIAAHEEEAAEFGRALADSFVALILSEAGEGRGSE